MRLHWRDWLPRSMTYNEGDTTARALCDVLQTTASSYRPCPGYEHVRDSFDRFYVGVDCDEVYPNIFVGNGATAKNKAYLKKIGVTHVLNTAEGSSFGMIDTDKYFYKGTLLKYLGLPMMDLPTTNIAKYFNETAEFIDSALITGGKVYVHCLMGISRSSTCVISYLMIKKGYTAAEAIRTVKAKRDIHPNIGFLQQLADLDNSLRRERLRLLH